LIQNKLHWYKYRFLRGRTVSAGPSLIHPQREGLLTSFSTWGTENILAEINLESTGVDKGL